MFISDKPWIVFPDWGWNKDWRRNRTFFFEPSAVEQVVEKLGIGCNGAGGFWVTRARGFGVTRDRGNGVYLGMGLLSCHRELGENWFKAVFEPILGEKYFDRKIKAYAGVWRNPLLQRLEKLGAYLAELALELDLTKLKYNAAEKLGYFSWFLGFGGDTLEQVVPELAG